MNAKIVDQLKTLVVSIDKCELDPKNARKNHNVEGISESLRSYGQRKPIIVNAETGFIEAGNGTFKAAKKLGWKTIAAVFVKDDPDTATGYSFADNRLTDQSEFDFDILKEMFESLTNIDLMDIPGVDGDFLDEIDFNLVINETEYPEIPTGEKEPFQRMTFTLSDVQAETVRNAIKKAHSLGAYTDTGNENSNGNALARIAEIFNGKS